MKCSMVLKWPAMGNTDSQLDTVVVVLFAFTRPASEQARDSTKRKSCEGGVHMLEVMMLTFYKAMVIFSHAVLSSKGLPASRIFRLQTSRSSSARLGAPSVD